MIWLLYGVLALTVLFLLARWFVEVDPRQLLRILRWLGIGLGVALIGFLAMRGMWAVLMPLLFGGLMFLRRYLAMSRRSNWASMPDMDSATGRTSEVRTATLRMTLDHDSGSLEGDVLQGAFRGRSLDSLSDDELLSLREECLSRDAESIQLVETYLDRRLGADWRQGREESPAPPPGGGPMDREEAYAVLGLEPGASDTEVRQAHHRLMKRLHPDQGGSTFLATKINQAKDLLLGNG